jgi:hypothetical protein
MLYFRWYYMPQINSNPLPPSAVSKAMLGAPSVFDPAAILRGFIYHVWLRPLRLYLGIGLVKYA